MVSHDPVESNLGAACFSRSEVRKLATAWVRSISSHRISNQRTRLFARLRHTHEHSSRETKHSRGPHERVVGDVFGHFPAVSHSVWGRVVADVPDFNRGLVAALAEG